MPNRKHLLLAGKGALLYSTPRNRPLRTETATWREPGRTAADFGTVLDSDVSGRAKVVTNLGRTAAAGLVLRCLARRRGGSNAAVWERGASTTLFGERGRCKAVAEAFACLRVVPGTVRGGKLRQASLASRRRRGQGRNFREEVSAPARGGVRLLKGFSPVSRYCHLMAEW